MFHMVNSFISIGTTLVIVGAHPSQFTTGQSYKRYTQAGCIKPQERTEGNTSVAAYLCCPFVLGGV